MRTRTVKQIQKALAALGPVLPGSISEQWNVCGKEGCRCKDPQRPRRHGPYIQLSFTVRGRSSTLFVKPEEVRTARRYVRNYQRFKALNAELALAYVAAAREGGILALDALS